MSKSKNLSEEEILVGGQAVIEGVLMRTPSAYAVAVRNPEGEIIVKKDREISWLKKNRFVRLPFIRGFFVLAQALKLGIKALNFSAEIALEEEKEKKKNKKKDSSFGKLTLIFSILTSVVLVILIFVAIPYFLSSHILSKTYGITNKTVISDKWLLFNLLDGVIRVIFFLGYIFIISLMKDIKRVFEYHGAEHKVVNLWESGEDLTVENAVKYTRFHPRCGTSFLIFVMIISIFIFTLFKIPTNSQSQIVYWLFKIGIRVLLLPVIAGISYEFIRLSAKYKDNKIFRLFILPGLWLQRITTQEPSKDQLEVSLKSLQEALELEKSHL